MGKTFKSIKKELDQDDRVTFGKHSGNTWFWVMENCPDYIIWCVGNTDLSFSYKLIVDAIKSKYAIKKKAAVDYDNAEYVPSRTTPDIGSSTFFKHHGDSFMGTHSDDWDDDVPF